MLQVLCHRLLNELTGQRCTMLAGHDKECQPPITWAELQDMCDRPDDGPLFEGRE